MEDSNQNEKNQHSRRNFLQLLGGALTLPLLGFAKPAKDTFDDTDEYQTLLKPDGTTVRVKKSVIDKSKIVEKNISNKSLLEWLKKNK